MIIEEFKSQTPIERIYWNIPNNIELYIKRDDLIDPLISGNKWRKLKYTLIDAREKNKNTLVSFGGAYSNHLIALAAAAARFNFKSVGFVRSDEGIPNNICMSLCQSMGMKIITVSREAYRDKNAIFNEYFLTSDDAYFIDEGGISALAAQGMQESMHEHDEVFTDIYLASGTGCSTAGVLNYVNEKKLNTKVHTVIVHKGIDEVLVNIQEFSNDISALQIHDTNELGRYAKHTPELLKFIIDFQKNTGILIDPIYTGKALFILYKNLQSLSKNCKILFIHTGGIWGNVGKIDAFNSLFSE
ncbi:MAG: 1-aminocyclopropane-1-carboxylate deaminase/D-cysteine desulfhydrase [bacterium]|jgi:1-aminocyclopropane-1-carboxylate deaminase